MSKVSWIPYTKTFRLQLNPSSLPYMKNFLPGNFQNSRHGVLHCSQRWCESLRWKYTRLKILQPWSGVDCPTQSGQTMMIDDLRMTTAELLKLCSSPRRPTLVRCITPLRQSMWVRTICPQAGLQLDRLMRGRMAWRGFDTADSAN